MIIIDGIKFYDEPGSCGTCEFLQTGNSDIYRSDKGFCALFEETHHTWCSVPRRCAKLFKKAFTYPDGTELVFVAKEQ